MKAKANFQSKFHREFEVEFTVGKNKVEFSLGKGEFPK